ncbi:hypothetical protein AK812_SmicGene32791 [Symbiodinium microadriaticum]|uniref:Integrase catalytic domain-containing protein n=1 Tax=Symbiodinium microadriaticum TaxID=2951 RepID=A0A1Q9CT78_SYMMI|nr:hypothetical protein AK812_SmicGene32791 [Symbiodinium microadriaticum]
MIKTTDEAFHKVFRAKVCPGNHRHCPVTDGEGDKMAYYPWRLVQAIVRHWVDRLVPLRHHHLLARADDLPSLCDLSEHPPEDTTSEPHLMEAEEVQDEAEDPDAEMLGMTESDRLVSENLAREARIQQNFTFEALASVLENALTKATKREGQQTRWSPGNRARLLLGGYSHGAFSGVTKETMRHKELVLYINSFLNHHLPGQQWSSLLLGLNSGTVPHKDHHNLHHSTNILTCTGNFAGGGLWIQGEGPGKPKRRLLADGSYQAQVSKFHKAAGHPTNRNLARIIKDANHPEWKIQVARDHYCPACASLRPGGTSTGQVPPISTHLPFEAWEAVAVDSGEWIPPGRRVKCKFLLFIDMATKLRAVQPLFEYNFLEMKTESGQDFIKAFSERWLGCYPKPKVVIMDSAKSFVSEAVGEFFSDINVMTHYVAEKEPWANGTIEAAVQDVKHTASAISQDDPDLSLDIVLHLTVSALNATEFTAGYSAHQWAVGKAHKATDEDLRSFATGDPRHDFAKIVSARERAEEIARTTRAKRALSKLGNTTVRQPVRDFAPMTLVKVWRKVWPKEQHAGNRGGFRKSGRPHWIGPGRVIFNEMLPHQTDERDRKHVVWVLIGHQLLRCSVHSVRPVDEVERFKYETSGEEDPSRWRSLADVLPRREYQDITDQEPDHGEVELPALPEQPDPSTFAVPTRRVRGKKGVTPELPPTDPLATGPMPSEPASSSTTPPPHFPPEANDYDQPESKKARTEDWVDQLYTEAQIENDSLDIYTAMGDVEEFLRIEFDVEPPTSNRQRKRLDRNPVAYLVKKMRDSEVNITRLSSQERQLFHRAKVKEVDSFIQNEAVQKCMNVKEVKDAYESGRIMRARWVLTWKSIPPEDRDEAKARIVLLGFQHPNLLDRAFKTSSPVQSTLGRNLLYLMATHHQWDLEGLDLATAFLQTMPTEADQGLYTSGVEELREALGVSHDGIMKIMKNIYGSTTAPRGLWLDLHKKLTALGAIAVMGERCLWIWLSKTEKDGPHRRVIGAMGGHVDDFHRIGDQRSAEWLAIRKSIDEAYKWGTAKVGRYRHAGDQAHNNRSKGDSTGGLITLAAGPEAGDGKVCPMCLISWRTWKLQRKALGSNDAEVQGVYEAEDQNFRVRLLWTEMHGAGGITEPRSNLVQDKEHQVLRVRGILCTDSKGGYDALERNESPLLGLSNMRAALQAFALRDNLKRVRCELRWLASDYDLADAMTKKRPDSRVGACKYYEPTDVKGEWHHAAESCGDDKDEGHFKWNTETRKWDEEESAKLEHESIEGEVLTQDDNV